MRDRPWSSLGMPDVVLLVGTPQPYRDNIHDELKLVWCSHDYVIQRRDRTHYARPEQLIALHPGEAHSGHPAAPDTPPNAQWRIACLPPSLLETVTAPARLRFEPPVLDDPGLAKQFLGVFALFEGELSRQERQDGLVELVTALLPFAAPTAPSDPLSPADHAAVRRAATYLSDRLSTNVTLDELADVTKVDRFRLVRACTAHFGLPPHTLHLRMRLDHARLLIRNGRQLGDVGQETGFHDQAHFSRTFTRAFGLTPTQYRASWSGTGPNTKLTMDP
jgi:AraC-like DNA-binding protein